MQEKSTIEYACSLFKKMSLIMNLSYNPSYICEFGVYKGESLRKIVDILGTQDYNIFGFDSFEGLPEDWLTWQGKIVGEGRKGRFSTGGNIPNIEGVKFYKGWFENTIPQFICENQKAFHPISLLHIDCDLYSSTKTVLENLNAFIVPSTLIVFDEWFYNHSIKCRDHEQKAFCEWATNFNRRYELVYYEDRTSSGSERQIVRILK